MIGGSRTSLTKHGVPRVIDFHSHLIPGVDDGASDLAQTRSALELLRAQGVRTVIMTPHMRGSLTIRTEEAAEYLARIDQAWEQVRTLRDAEFPDLRVERGMEVMLDNPTLDLSDPRVRLAGTGFVLLEFPFMTIPPNAVAALFQVKMAGWTPVIAHPERYANLDESLADVEEWCRIGAFLQVNSGSLLGRYGSREKGIAWALLERGLAHYLSSDYHARGRCAVAESRAEMERRGAGEQMRLLTEINPARLLDGAPPLPVPPIRRPRWSWSWLLGRRTR